MLLGGKKEKGGVTAQATTKTTCNIYLCEKTMAQGEVEGSHGGGKRKKIILQSSALSDICFNFPCEVSL